MTRQPHAHPDRSVSYMARRIVLAPRPDRWDRDVKAVGLAIAVLLFLGGLASLFQAGVVR